MTKYTKVLLYIDCQETPQHKHHQSFVDGESEELLKELKRIETETPQDNRIPFQHTEKEVSLGIQQIQGDCPECQKISVSRGGPKQGS